MADSSSTTAEDEGKPKALLDGETRAKPHYVKQRSVQIVDPRPEVIEVREKHGPLYNAIPRMPLGLAIVCCLFNIVIPGVGEWFCVLHYENLPMQYTANF